MITKKQFLFYTLFLGLIYFPMNANSQTVDDGQEIPVEEISSETSEKAQQEQAKQETTEPELNEEKNAGSENTELNPEAAENQKSEVTEKHVKSPSSLSVRDNNNSSTTEASDKDTATKTKKDSSFSDEDVRLLFKLAFIIFLVWAFYKITKYRYKRKCDSCGKWNSMKVVNKELVDKKSSTVTEKRKVRDSQGNTLRSYEVDVPATVYIYHIHRCCKHCGHKDIVIQQEKHKN
jgi:hypothetical protein